MQLLTLNRRPGRKATAREPSGEPPTGAAADRTRTMVVAAIGPLLAGYAAVAAVLALVTAIAPSATFSVSGVLRAAFPGWLAAYQVSITISGRPLGVFPLAATAGMCVLVARSAGNAARRLGYGEPGQAVSLVVPMGAAHGLLGLVIAVSSQGAAASARPFAAFVVPGLIAALAATAGLARPCGLLSSAQAYLDPVAIRGLRAGALAVAGLIAVGALVVTLSLVSSVPTVGHLFAVSAPGFGSGVGMLLLSLGYFPNAVVCGLSFAAGPGFSVGPVSVNPFVVTPDRTPEVPLLAGIPEHRQLWWALLMLLPAAVGALVGNSVRDRAVSVPTRLRTVAIAGMVAGFGCVLLGSLAGGRLGAGPFDPVAMPIGLLSLAAFGWIVIPGGLVAWLAGPAHPAAEPGPTESEAAEETAGDAPEETSDEVPEDLADEAEEETGSESATGLDGAAESSEATEAEQPDTAPCAGNGEESEAEQPDTAPSDGNDEQLQAEESNIPPCAGNGEESEAGQTPPTAETTEESS